jgi:hypothetical protein
MVVTVPPDIMTPLVVATPPAVTTPEGVVEPVVPGLGIGVGTAVPGPGLGWGIGTTVAGAVITGPALYDGVLVPIRLRSRAIRPMRRGCVVPVVVTTVGVVVVITGPVVGTGWVVVAGGSAAGTAAADRQATATVNRNRFTMLPPETNSTLTPGRPFSPVESVRTV